MKNFLRTLFNPPHPLARTRVMSDAEREALWELRKGQHRAAKAMEHGSRKQNFDRHAAERVRPATSPRLPRVITEEPQWIAL